MTKFEVLDLLPDAEKGVVVILSGGLDSTVATRLAVEKYGSLAVHALTFDYGQRQKKEISLAKKTCEYLSISHEVISLDFFNKINQGFSANVDTKIVMPKIKDVLGDPQPKTYLSNRNMLMLTIASAYAETNNLEYVICGLQETDNYNYWDCTPNFIDSINNVFSLNRKNKIQVIAPFSRFSKSTEILLMKDLGDLHMLENTLTCYNPLQDGKSCGKCPSCAERIQAFKTVGLVDLVEYDDKITIPW